MNEKTTIRVLTEENFQKEVLDFPGPVLVEFRARWCGACQIVDPILNRLAAEYKGKIKFAMLDVENNQRIAKEYAVWVFPTLIFLSNGRVVGHVIGVSSEKDFKAKLQSLL